MFNHRRWKRANDSTYASSKYTVSTYAGNGLYKLHGPTALCIDDNGVLYASETNNNDIIKIDPLIQTVGILTSAPNVTFPGDLWIDDNGNLYISGYGDGYVKAISPSGSVTAVEFNNPNLVSMDPTGAVVDAQGNIIIADNIGLFEIVAATHNLVSLGTHGVSAGAIKDGSITSASDSLISCIPENENNNIYIADAHRIRKIMNGSITTVAGGASIGNADGPAAGASFGRPMALSANTKSDVFIAYTYNNSVRELT